MKSLQSKIRKLFFSLLTLLVFSFIQSAFATEPVKQVYVDASVQGSFENLSKLSGFQLISHGRPGELLIEGEWKNAEKIAAFVQSEISNQKSRIQHVNIYGCEFAKGETGKAAVAYLQKALGVSVSASDDITGKGGDWVLETGVLVAIKGMASYPYSLQCITPSTVNPDADGDGVPDVTDADDDNDGIPDLIECGSQTGDFVTLLNSSVAWSGPTASTVTITTNLTTPASDFSSPALTRYNTIDSNQATDKVFFLQKPSDLGQE